MSEKVQAQIRAIKEGFMAIATKLEELDKHYNELPAEVKAEIESIPRIDLAELEELPWTKWQKDAQGNRIPAKQGEPGWIKNPVYFTSLKAPPAQLELVKAIKRAGGKLELGDYAFSFSGKDGMFITRRPKEVTPVEC
jgi:hypothetical protein